MTKSYIKLTFQKMPLLNNLSNINTAEKYKIVRNEMYNLQLNLHKLKTRKKRKIYIIVRIELSINENPERPET